jgi:hypothetical protein
VRKSGPNNIPPLFFDTGAPKHAFKITSTINGTITEIHRDIVVDQPIPKEEFVPKASIENSD